MSTLLAPQQNELKATDRVEYAMYSVALRELLDLAQASRHQVECVG